MTEGQTLMRDIDGRLGSIALHLETIAAGAKGFVEHYRAQLIARITELAPELVARERPSSRNGGSSLRRTK